MYMLFVFTFSLLLLYFKFLLIVLLWAGGRIVIWTRLQILKLGFWLGLHWVDVLDDRQAAGIELKAAIELQEILELLAFVDKIDVS